MTSPKKRIMFPMYWPKSKLIPFLFAEMGKHQALNIPLNILKLLPILFN